MAAEVESREERRRRKQAEAARRRKEADPEGWFARRKTANQKYRENHPEKVLAEQQARNKKNPARMQNNNRRFRESNPDYARIWYRANASRMIVIRKEWRAQNPDRLRQYSHSRRARQLNAPGKHTRNDVLDIHRLQKGKCACCKTGLASSYEIDHIIPLSRGGGNDRRNIQLLCRSCNRRKSARDPMDFMRSRGLLL